VVAALAAVNAFGDVIDEQGRVLAGARSADGLRVEPALAALLGGAAPGAALDGRNTTIAVVATNVALTKAEAARVARMAQDGLARAIAPAHTPVDGDTVFVLSVGGGAPRPTSPLVVGTLAAEVVARAIRRGVRRAHALPGLPAAGDFIR
jgi:L-aminopeptidase/D-esterase-like protein